MSDQLPPLIIRLQTERFDPPAEIMTLTKGHHDIGAIVSFTGLCRDENRRLTALELEVYLDMAYRQLHLIAEEACRRWPLLGLCVIHRYGRILAGEEIVLVASLSSHRRAAFESCDFVMDFLKSRAPFWKKEFLGDGEASQWVEAREIDEAALERWQK